jgi:hypothetical protein
MVLRCSSHPHAPLYPPQCVIEAQICAHIRSFKCVFPSLPLSHRPLSVFVSLAPCHAALHRPRVIQHCILLGTCISILLRARTTLQSLSTRYKLICPADYSVFRKRFTACWHCHCTRSGLQWYAWMCTCPGSKQLCSTQL